MPQLTGSNLSTTKSKSEKPVKIVRNYEHFLGFSKNKEIWPFVSWQQGFIVLLFSGSKGYFNHQQERSETIVKETMKFFNWGHGIDI